MPLYEYRCPSCGSEFERLTSFALADDVSCPDCQHTPAKRRMSRVAARSRDGAGDSYSASSACAPSPGGG